MKSITYIFLVLISYSCCSQEESKIAKVPAFTITSHPKVLDIFDEPDGKINRTLSLEGEEGIYFAIVNKSKGNWLRINIQDLNLINVWIKAGTVGVSTRNYDGQNISLYEAPNLQSKKINYLKGEQLVTILKVCDNWAYVEGVGANNQKIEGWLQPDMQCGDTLSTCP